MNVLVTHAYSRENKGDAAILSVLISELRRVFDKPDITVSMMDSGKSQYFDGVKVIPSYMYLRIARHDSQLLKLLDATMMLVTTIAWATIVRYFSYDLPLVRRADREILTAMSKADLIVPIGGGYIRTKTNKEIITLIFSRIGMRY